MNNNIDISLTLGTRADMSGINQVRKGVDDLSTAGGCRGNLFPEGWEPWRMPGHSPGHPPLAR